jgi:hypothetical protein
MSGDSNTDSHPARKVNLDELKQFLVEKREDVPAVTTRIVADEFSEVKPGTVHNNLKSLSDDEKICRLNDGDVVLWWYPRECDEAGDVPYNELVEDTVDYSEVDPKEVPRDLAEKIATERLPFYRPQSLWSNTANLGQVGIMISLGLIILGFGVLVSGTLGLNQQAGALIFRSGFYVALLSLGVYLVSLVLDILTAWGYVSRDPFPWIRKILE